MAGPERQAFIRSDPDGFYIRHPGKASSFTDFITSEDELFQTIHMGAAVVDSFKWILRIDGLVSNPITLSLEQLRSLPSTTITSFHECYGSPLKPPTTNVWRIGNVRWTGVRLRDLLELVSPLDTARFVVSDGLDRGSFGGVTTDRYQKDLPLVKAMSPEVLIAYQMNSMPLSKNRGGPVRLVVPGWFGTNSTKWLCKLSLTTARATGPFTTKFYNEVNPDGNVRPVWEVAPNSLIVHPTDASTVIAGSITFIGMAWSNGGIQNVSVIATDESGDKVVSCDAVFEARLDFSWQAFHANLPLSSGSYMVFAQATSCSGETQPPEGRRNHVHRITIHVA